MTLLTPLGLLGLLGVVALIIIYIIKPNFQQKFISSTYIWKLSLKYRKKKIPTSKLRNILLILCQILLLTSCAFILAQPNKVLRSLIKEPEVVMIIDSSASMRTQVDGKTRYARAVEEARFKAAETFDANGYVTVIVADESPEYLMQLRMRADSRLTLDRELTALLEEDQCSYASSNVDGAVELCETVLLQNPNAKVFLYTDTEYGYRPQQIECVSVREEMEWNAAVLDATTQYDQNKYAFYVDVACYGIDANLSVKLHIEGANAVDSLDSGSKVDFIQPVLCLNNETEKILFISQEIYRENVEIYDTIYENNIYLIPEGKGIISYHSICVTLTDEEGNELTDSLADDDAFYIYGGMKQVIKIQYASSAPNSFWPAAIRQLRNVLDDRWDIQYTEVKRDTEPATTGFDLYIFEHEAPEKLPEDGVIWLMAPMAVPTDSGIRVTPKVIDEGKSVPVEVLATHPILENIVGEEITVSMYSELMLDASYEPLLGVGEYTMFAVRNDDMMKIAITAFNLHYSNLAVLVEFPVLVYNMFSYFFPTTVNGNAFNVNEEVQLQSMSETLEVLGYEYHQKYTTFPATFIVSKPGTYTLKQINFTGREFREQIYVRMPKEESNIFSKGEFEADLYIEYDKDEFYEDYLFYITILLVSVAFIEWWLRNHKGA